MKKITITLYSHHFVVGIDRNCPIIKKIISSFLRKNNIQYILEKKGGTYHTVAGSRFYATTSDRSQFRIHFNQLDDFINHLNHECYPNGHGNYEIIDQRYTQEDIDSFTPFEFGLVDGFPPLRENQIKALEHCLKPLPAGGDMFTRREYANTRLIELKTGEGKSIVSLLTCSYLKSKVVFVFKPYLIDKWIQDICNTTTIEENEIYVVSGSDSLKKLQQLYGTIDLKEDPYKVILISSNTYVNYLDAYEQHMDGIMEMGYACLPITFFKHINAKVVMIDEGHENFRMTFMLQLHSNIHLLLVTSATMTNGDRTYLKMIEVSYPQVTRYNPEYKTPYVKSCCVRYRFNAPGRIRYMSNRGYNHTGLETSVLNQPKVMEHYFEMIKWIIDRSFVPAKESHPTYRAIVFCSTVDMCSRLTKYLGDLYPKYTVSRYTSEDSFSNLMESDICISTPGSAGTAVDIPDLYLNIMTVAARSERLNKQIHGRLRKMKDGNTPLFYWLSCIDITKHLEYDQYKREFFQEKSVCMDRMEYPKLI